MKKVTTIQLYYLLELTWKQLPASRPSKSLEEGESVWPHFYKAIAFVASYYQLYPSDLKIDPIYDMLCKMNGVESENVAHQLLVSLLSICIAPPGEWKASKLLKNERVCP